MADLLGKQMVGTKRGKLIVMDSKMNPIDKHSSLLVCKCLKCDTTFDKDIELFRKEKFVQSCITCDGVQTTVIKKVHDLKNVHFREVDPGFSTIVFADTPPVLDLASKVIGQIEVFHYTRKSIGRNRVWNCYCGACDTYVELTGRQLISRRPHCGCLSESNTVTMTEKNKNVFGYQERNRAKFIGTIYEGFKILDTTTARLFGEVVYKVQAPDNEVLLLSRKQMRTQAPKYQNKK